MGIIRDNPIFWREAVPRRLRHASDLQRTAGVLSVPVITLAYAFFQIMVNSETPDHVILMFGWSWALTTIWVVAARSAQALVAERLRGTWDAVMLSRLGPGEIFFGKLFGALALPWAAGLLMLPTCSLLAAITPLAADRNAALVGLARAYGTGAIGSVCCGAVGLCFSRRCSSVWAAELWTLLLLTVVVAAWVVWQIAQAIAVSMAMLGTHP